ncbi:helix-turn-helix transcriptional regulator [Motilibacter peucedani]|nr:helix-turn-helix transcriptional regulator [Motilibacter peucedani]
MTALAVAPATAPPVAGQRRSELASFLRACRSRVSPLEVGLPQGNRRRTPGLRREEVAQLAGVGVTWYTWLEQSRPINASTQVLDAVARVLQLDTTEHAHLYRLAGLPSAAPRSERRPRVSPHVAQVVAALGEMPAALLNSRYDILLTNAAYDRLFRRFHTVASDHYNVMWCCFTEPEIRSRFLGWDDESARMVATLRGAYVENLGDPTWDRFVAELCGRSAEFARLWQRHEVASPGMREKRFVHPQVGLLSFVTTSLAVVEMPGCRVVAYAATDDATRDGLRRLDDPTG